MEVYHGTAARFPIKELTYGPDESAQMGTLRWARVCQVFWTKPAAFLCPPPRNSLAIWETSVSSVFRLLRLQRVSPPVWE